MIKDILGQEITNGSLIAYGVRSGNSGDLHIGVIKDVNKTTVIPLLVEYTWMEKKKWVYRLGRVGVLSGWDKVVCLMDKSIKDDKVFELYKQALNLI